MNNYPLIKFVLLFIIGIVFQITVQLTNTSLIISFLIFFVSSTFFQAKHSQKMELFKIISIFLTVIFFGSLYFQLLSDKKVNYPFPQEKYSNTIVRGTVDNIMLKREGKILFYLKSDSIRTNSFRSDCNYNFLCSISDKQTKVAKLYNEIKIGNKISVMGNLFRPRNKRNPGEYDYEKYLNGNGIIGIVNSYKTEDVEIISNKTSILNFIHEVRKSIDSQITSIHNRTTSALLRGLLLADRSAIDYETRNEFVNAGVIHVLAVSGLHVGYIILIFTLIFNRFNIFVKLSFTVLGLIFFLLITGMPASVFRAVVMAIVLIIGQIFGRDYNGVNSISLAASIILLLNPHELFNPGFQLSFSAVLSIIVLYPKLSSVINSWEIKSNFLRWTLLFFCVSLAAQIGTLPFTLVYFNKLSIVALLANIIVIPLIGFIVGLGILSIVIGILSFSFASLFSSCNELFTYLLFTFVKIIGSDGFSYLSVNQFSIYDAIIFYITLVLIFLIFKVMTKINAKIIAIIFSIMLMFILMRMDDFELMPNNNLSILTIDVGQGDAFLIKFPNGKSALIDAGDATENFDNGERVIIPLMNKLGIDKIDFGFISHVDSDHYKGFLSLIKNGRIKIIYKPKLYTNLTKDIEFEKYLRLYNIPFKYYSKNFLTIGNTRLYILNDTTKSYFESSNSNDKSGMLKLVYGKNAFLFTGDASTNVEQFYIKNYKSFLNSNVLKVGHHGSKTSTSGNFLNYVKPNYAIISAGVMNKFNHPSKETISKLNERKINILRTDKYGALLFRSNGYEILTIDWKKTETLLDI